MEKLDEMHFFNEKEIDNLLINYIIFFYFYFIFKFGEQVMQVYIYYYTNYKPGWFALIYTCIYSIFPLRRKKDEQKKHGEQWGEP